MTNTGRGASVALAAAVAVTTGIGACGGGGYGNSTPTAPTASTPTITITATGASPQTVRVTQGQRVAFVNSDSRMHEMLSVPHLLHNDCPPLNEVGALSPGANRQSGPLNDAKSCGFHDHANPDDQRFRGQILVGGAQAPPEPIYSGPK